MNCIVSVFLLFAATEVFSVKIIIQSIADSASIFCTWTFSTEDYAKEVIIINPQNITYVHHWIRDLYHPILQLDLDAKYTAELLRSKYGANRMVLRIANATCTDEGVYTCRMFYSTPSGNSEVSQSKELSVETLPRAPDFLVIDTPFPDGSNTLEEKTIFNVRCHATTGRVGEGKILWTLYRNNISEQLPPTDKRITSRVEIKFGGCQEVMQSFLKYRLTRRDQYFSVACFIANVKYRPKRSLFCGRADQNLCQLSVGVHVLSGVSKSFLHMSQTPKGKIVEGMTVTLICTAEAYPVPTFTWTKITSKGSQPLTGKVKGHLSQLTLTNVTIDKDLGTYSCTAENTVRNKTYNAVQTSFLAIDMTTGPPAEASYLPPVNSTVSSRRNDAARSFTDGEISQVLVDIILAVLILMALVCIALICFCLHKHNIHPTSVSIPPSTPNPPTQEEITQGSVSSYVQEYEAVSPFMKKRYNNDHDNDTPDYRPEISSQV